MFGVIRDISLCRWDGVVMLPGYNNQLNVFQPVYTHMFETILAGPKPHYYVHLYTPGETPNSINPSDSPSLPSCCVAIAQNRTQKGHSACIPPQPSIPFCAAHGLTLTSMQAGPRI
jgi:hypothetical protein